MAELKRRRRLLRTRTFLGWLLLGDRRCHDCGGVTMRLRKPLMLESLPQYDRCCAVQSGTWAGDQPIPTCWNVRGHEGQHSDEVVVRWSDPIIIDFRPVR